MTAAASTIGIKLVPYQLCRSGPSWERLRNERALLEVQRRGQWRLFASVARYAKSSRCSAPTTKSRWGLGIRWKTGIGCCSSICSRACQADSASVTAAPAWRAPRESVAPGHRRKRRRRRRVVCRSSRQERREARPPARGHPLFGMLWECGDGRCPKSVGCVPFHRVS